MPFAVLGERKRGRRGSGRAAHRDRKAKLTGERGVEAGPLVEADGKNLQLD